MSKLTSDKKQNGKIPLINDKLKNINKRKPSES